MREKRRVLVGMSGGVDSSASCVLLQEQGYEVVGVTLRMWDRGNTDFIPQFIGEAQILAAKLGIEHHTEDIRVEFKSGVIKPFIDEYMNGRTPNPCVICNPQFKWRFLLECAERYNCDAIATGHYVNSVYENGIYWIEEGEDKSKDQSYFLWGLTQEELSKTIFPLGKYKKQEIKEKMRTCGFPEKAEKRESMEICFIKSDYRSFLREQIPDIDSRLAGGYFVDSLGKRLGKHKGYPFYTIGQRKGLEIALGHPAYVTKINPCKNTVKLGTEEDLFCSGMIIERCLFPDTRALNNSDLTVRIRYRSKSVSINSISVEGDKAVVYFKDPTSAVAPGQSAVFYCHKRVVGGGIIAASISKTGTTI